MAQVSGPGSALREASIRERARGCQMGADKDFMLTGVTSQG
jgi:hypothetical protein